MLSQFDHSGLTPGVGGVNVGVKQEPIRKIDTAEENEKESDPIVKRIKVMYCRDLTNLSILQYPLRPPTRPVDSESEFGEVLEVKYKSEETITGPHRRLSCRPRGCEIALRYDAPRGSNRDRNSRATKDVHLKSNPILTQANHVACFMRDGQLYMLPIQQIHQMKPDYSKLVPSAKKEDPDVNIPLWMNLTPVKSQVHDLEKQVQRKCDDVPITPSIGSKFVNRLLGPHSSSKTSKLLSRQQILQLKTLDDQVEMLMRQALILNFTEIVKYLKIPSKSDKDLQKLLDILQDVSFLIHGVWIVKTERVIDRKKLDILFYQRNCLLELLAKSDFVKRADFVAMAKTDVETTETLLKSICVYDKEGKYWIPKAKTDGFADMYPQISDRHKGLLKELSESQNKIREQWKIDESFI